MTALRVISLALTGMLATTGLATGQDLPRAVACTGEEPLVVNPATITIVVHQDSDGTVTLTRTNSTSETVYPLGPLNVLSTVTEFNLFDGTQLTGMITENEAEGVIYIPTLWLVDWHTPALQRTMVQTNFGTLAVNETYTCEAVAP